MMISSSSKTEEDPSPPSAPKNLIRRSVKIFVLIVFFVCAHGMFGVSWKDYLDVRTKDYWELSFAGDSSGGGGLSMTNKNISTTTGHREEGKEEEEAVSSEHTQLERERLPLTGVPTTDPKNSTADSFGIRSYYEALPQVIKDRLKKTAIFVTYKGVLTECERARLKHLIETTPGVDIWISHAHSKLDEQARNMSLSNIRSLPGTVQLVEQSTTGFIEGFDDAVAGTSKSSFLRFVAGPQAEKYDFVWLIENDVWYTGPWIELFQDEARDHVSDLVPITLIHQRIWERFRRCRFPGGSCRAIAPLQLGYMLTRVSTRYAKRILPALEGRLIYGHHEAVPAQFAILNNMTIRPMDPTKVGVNRFGITVTPHKIRNFGTASLIHPLKCKTYDRGELNIHADLAKYSYRAPMMNQDRDKMIWDRSTTGGRKLHIYKIVGSQQIAKQSSIMDSWDPKDSPTTFVEIPLIDVVTISEMIANGTLSFWNETELELANLQNFTRVVEDGGGNETLSFLSETLAGVMAIQQAYTAGHDAALIVPTTTFIPRLFAAQWANQLATLTKKKGQSWNMFQWQSNPAMPLLNKNGMDKIEPWDCTKHGSRGNHPFTISRQGMKAVLSQVQNGNEKNWKIPLVRSPLFALTLPSVYVSAQSLLFIDPAAIDHWPSFFVSPEFL